MPELDQSPDPQINYPQGFVGTIDEVGAWTTSLTQAQVQEAMTTPIAQDSDLAAGLVDDFDFNQAPTNDSWPNQAPGGSGVAQGPTSGTTPVQVAATIPTDPFTGVPSLPGALGWGIGVMTPLTASDVNVTEGSTYPARVALDAGDQLWFQVQNAEEGTLIVQVETDQGNTQTITVGAGEQEALRATETGTYDLNLSWTPDGSTTGQVTIQDVPGPLDSLMELLTSYANTVTINGASHVVYNWAYSEPGLASPSDQVGFNAGDVAAAAYWPLWSDTTTFQPPDGTGPAAWAAELSAAYAKLVAASPDLKSIGYANVIGVSFLQQPFDQFVADVQSDLETAYTNAYGAAPPAVGQPASAPQDVVYQLLSRADTERTALYTALGNNNADTLPQWVNEYIQEIQSNASVQGLESNIVADQGSQIGNLTFNISSESLLTGQLIGEGAADAALSALSAITGLSSLGFPVLGRSSPRWASRSRTTSSARPPSRPTRTSPSPSSRSPRPSWAVRSSMGWSRTSRGPRARSGPTSWMPSRAPPSPRPT